MITIKEKWSVMRGWDDVARLGRVESVVATSVKASPKK